MIVDASLVVAAFKPTEVNHELARDWLQRALLGTVSAPAILLPEVSSGVARASGDQDLAERIVARLMTSGLAITAVDVGLGAESARIARLYGLKGCDAVYVALAARMGEPLITLDDEQVARGRAVADVRRPQTPMDVDDDGD